MTSADAPDKNPSCVASPATSPQRWHDADATGRREMIVQTALELLHHEGLPAVTMRAVASRLGVGTMTLYTYIEGQHGLHREMVRRGFEMLNGQCKQQHQEVSEANVHDWRAGARCYIDFALAHPNLYKLMFDHPMGPEDTELLRGGFDPYLERVTAKLEAQGCIPRADLCHEARRGAGRLWITLHGIAMLAIAGRFCVLEADLDEIIADLVPRVAPT